jgi:hypothetical protein
MVRVLKIPGSNLGPETVHIQAMQGQSLVLGHDLFLPYPFQFIAHLSPCH